MSWKRPTAGDVAIGAILAVILTLTAITVIMFFAGCRWPDPVPPGPVPGAGCTDACSALQTHDCPDAKGSPGRDEVYGTADDVSCTQVCTDTEAEGVSMHTECIAGINSCDDVAVCWDAE